MLFRSGSTASTKKSTKPNPCLAPLRKGPYYAMRLDAGDIGTKGGLLTNQFAQVVRENGQPIAGLYAIGNCSASVMGTSYPGAGGTLGPAMTFGYIAANHIARRCTCPMNCAWPARPSARCCPCRSTGGFSVDWSRDKSPSLSPNPRSSFP